MGCAPRTVTVYKETKIAPDDALLVNCKSSPPPSIGSLTVLQLTKEEIATMEPETLSTLINRAIRATTSAYMDQTNNITVCNGRLELLREWKELQTKNE